jgi:FkbH-like protein
LQLTEEDRKRGELYSGLKKAKAAAINMEEFIKGLEMQLSIEVASPQTIPRIAQLTQKTNQFNMSTRRYTEEEIARMAQSDNFRVLSFRVRDRFGEHGIVGVLILKKEKENCLIDTFLLSCRVIGREIENQMLASAIEEARRMKAGTLLTQLIPTEKNLPAQDFFRKQPTTFEIEKR